jgi:hypothetical protein
VKHHKFTQPTGLAQMTRTDARATPAAVAALDQLQRSKPLVPPHLHIFVAGKCKRCGKAEG